MTRDEWAVLTADEQFEYLQLLERRDAELKQLLQLVPCPEHGECIPYIKEWVRDRLKADAAKESIDD